MFLVQKNGCNLKPRKYNKFRTPGPPPPYLGLSIFKFFYGFPKSKWSHSTSQLEMAGVCKVGEQRAPKTCRAKYGQNMIWAPGRAGDIWKWRFSPRRPLSGYWKVDLTWPWPIFAQTGSQECQVSLEYNHLAQVYWVAPNFHLSNILARSFMGCA